MILANGCNITKSEKLKGVWILSVPTVYKCSQTTRHIWIWTENDRNSRVASAWSPWSQPLVRLSESRACTMRTLVKAPSSENPPKAKHTQWQMLSYCEQSASSGADSACFAPKQTTHKLCVSPPIKKRGREEHTAYVCLHSYNEK